MVAQCCTANARNFPPESWPFASWRLLVCAQSRKGLCGELLIALRHLPYQFEKQRQWPWCAFMLQCRMLR